MDEAAPLNRYQLAELGSLQFAAVAVASLPRGARVEIEAVAAVPSP